MFIQIWESLKESENIERTLLFCEVLNMRTHFCSTFLRKTVGCQFFVFSRVLDHVSTFDVCSHCLNFCVNWVEIVSDNKQFPTVFKNWLSENLTFHKVYLDLAPFSVQLIKRFSWTFVFFYSLLTWFYVISKSWFVASRSILRFTKGS